MSIGRGNPWVAVIKTYFWPARLLRVQTFKTSRAPLFMCLGPSIAVVRLVTGVLFVFGGKVLFETTFLKRQH